MKLESLTQVSMTVAEYEARYFQLSCHATCLISTKAERVCRFMIDLIVAIRSYVFRSAYEGTFFQTIVSIAKEAELMVREEFGGPKRAQASGHYLGASLGGRGFH